MIVAESRDAAKALNLEWPFRNGSAVGNRLSDGMLGGTEHLHGLFSVLIVTLLNITVAIKLGATTASSDVNPFLLFVKQFANAFSAALPRGPMMRSM